MRRGLVAGMVVALAACEETTTAPTLSATCSANPASGPAPLAVSFNLAVAGATGTPQIRVDYGDGSTGTNPDVVHLYASAGLYTAAFTVAASGQTARCAATVSVVTTTLPTVPIANVPPTAVFRTTPEALPGDQIVGASPLVVRYNMCPSADPDGDRLLFTMDFNGDGRNEVEGTSGANCRRDSTAYLTGAHTAHVCVTDMDATGRARHGFQCRTYRIVVS